MSLFFREEITIQSLSRYNEWGNGVWNLQKQGLQDPSAVQYHWLGFMCGSDDHEQLGKLHAIMSGKILQALGLFKHYSR